MPEEGPRHSSLENGGRNRPAIHVARKIKDLGRLLVSQVRADLQASRKTCVLLVFSNSENIYPMNPNR